MTASLEFSDEEQPETGERCARCYYDRESHERGEAMMPLGTIRCPAFVPPSEVRK